MVFRCYVYLTLFIQNHEGESPNDWIICFLELRKGALFTHVPFRAEGGAKRVFALAVYGKMFRALEPMFLPCWYCSLHRKGGAAA